MCIRDRLFTRACAASDPEGCYQLALGWGDAASRAANYKTACDGGHARACNDLGYRYDMGDGVAKDEVHARALYEKACAAGDAMACGNLGIDLRDGIGGPKDVARGAQIFLKGCDGGHLKSCARLAEMHDSGEGAT